MQKGEMLSRMLEHATWCHAGQFDKAGMPYILHPLKVMHYLKTEDEELMCIALGHDLLEDCSDKTNFVTLMDIGMSKRVVDGILALTKEKGQTYNEYKTRVLSSEDAMRVKLCDLRHNTDIRRLKGVTEKDLQRTQRYYKFYTEIEYKLKEIEHGS